MTKNPYKVIKGELSTKASINEWSETKIVSFLHFINLFTEGDKFCVTRIKRDAAKERQEDFWLEFLSRIDDESCNDQKFRNRLIAMARNVLAWIKANPHAMTQDIRNLMVANPRTHWALESFKEVENKNGSTSVVLDNDENTNIGTPNASPFVTDLKTPQAIFNQSLMNMATALNQITSSFKPSELKKLGVEQKLKLATSMVTALSKQFTKQAPNSVTFQKIVVNKAGRDELESALMDYSNAQNDEE